MCPSFDHLLCYYYPSSMAGLCAADSGWRHFSVTVPGTSLRDVDACVRAVVNVAVHVVALAVMGRAVVRAQVRSSGQGQTVRRYGPERRRACSRVPSRVRTALGKGCWLKLMGSGAVCSLWTATGTRLGPWVCTVTLWASFTRRAPPPPHPPCVHSHPLCHPRQCTRRSGVGAPRVRPPRGRCASALATLETCALACLAASAALALTRRRPCAADTVAWVAVAAAALVCLPSLLLPCRTRPGVADAARAWWPALPLPAFLGVWSACVTRHHRAGDPAWLPTVVAAGAWTVLCGACGCRCGAPVGDPPPPQHTHRSLRCPQPGTPVCTSTAFRRLPACTASALRCG